MPGAGMGYGSVATATEYAGFGTRFVALLLDGLLLGFGGLIILIPVFLIFGLAGFVLYLAIQAAYFILCFTRWDGQTVGGRAMGIKVVDVNGGLLTPTAALIRWAVANASTIVSLLATGAGSTGLSGIGFLLSIGQLFGYLMMLWDPKKQTLQDKAAGSYVIQIRR